MDSWDVFFDFFLDLDGDFFVVDFRELITFIHVFLDKFVVDLDNNRLAAYWIQFLNEIKDSFLKFSNPLFREDSFERSIILGLL